MSKTDKDPQKNVAQWRTIQFIPDKALKNFNPDLGEFDSSDAPRSEAVADQLARQLSKFIQAGDSRYPLKTVLRSIFSKKVMTSPALFLDSIQNSFKQWHTKCWNPPHLCIPPRIGILGGLGQGKTTVIHWALVKMEQNALQFRQKKWQQSWSVEWFDTAFYKSDELEHELDRLLGSIAPSNLRERLCSISAYLAILILMLTAVFIFPLIFPEELSAIKKIPISLKLITLSAGTFIAYIFKPWRYWWRSGQREMTLGSKNWWKQGLKLLRGTVQILVIDNLDRANLKQQRAILRSIYKHQDQLGYAVVIGYDETQLLMSNPDPESPRELLNKSINIEARMPVRVLTDTLRLAWMASAQAARLNPDLAFLKAPRAVGALAKVMELLSSIQVVSPRVAKHMVNNGLFFLAHVQENEQPELDDWCAILRLLSLHTVLPQLRLQGDALRDALQSNQVNGLKAVTDLFFTHTNETEIDPNINLAQTLFNVTRMYNPANLDWAPWVVLWATRAFADESLGQPTHHKQLHNDNELKIPDFDSINFLSDGLHRLIKGKPYTSLVSFSDLLSGLGDLDPDQRKHTIYIIAQALLPLVGLFIVQLKERSERQQLLTGLWSAANNGSLNWIFEQTDKGDFLVCLSELMLIEQDPWPLTSQKVFSSWWQHLSDTELNIASTRRVRLLSLVPASSFHLADILACSANAQNKFIQHDLGPETWLTSYNSTNNQSSKLTLFDDPVKQFLENNIGSENVKRYWPTIRAHDSSFSKLLIEHCDAWRRLQLRGALQLTPLEFLLFNDDAFAEKLQSREFEDVLAGLTPLFFDGYHWSGKSWLTLLKFMCNMDPSLKTFRQLRKRFLPLLKKPAINQQHLHVQVLLAATFADIKGVNQLTKKLTQPLPEKIATILIENLQWWVSIYASIWHEKHPVKDVIIYKNTLIKSWVANLQKDTWDKVFSNTRVSDDWKQLHTAHWHTK